MALYKYTLPSGSEFSLNAPDGTTQAQADLIFYEQVAAGTFVGYRVGDSLNRPEEALSNFGLTRLERGTAGVDDRTLLAIIQNLPLVSTLPNLNGVVANSVTQADVILAKEGLGPSAIGPLSPPQVQTILGQTLATVDQPSTELTQAKGLGAYGLNALQLERACYLKPGTVDRYLGGVASNTFSNPANFKEVLGTPGIWTGKDGVTSADMLLASPELQAKVQTTLMQNSYKTLVSAGAIAPKTPAASQPYTGAGQVYSSSQTLVATTALTVIASGLGYNGSNTLFSDFSGLFRTAPPSGSNIVNQIPGGDITTLASGAISSTAGAVAAVGQVNSVNSALTAASAVTTAVNQDIGALVATSSKVGTAVTTAWAQGTKVLDDPKAAADRLLAGAQDQANSLITNIEGQVRTAADTARNQATALVDQGKQAMDNLAKAAKNAVAFADTKLSSLVAGVKKAAAFSNTVDRTTVDAAITRVIGSDKIPSPKFELPNLASLGVTQDIAKAQEIIKQAQATSTAIINQGQQLYAQATAVGNQAQAAVNTAQNQINIITPRG